MKALKFKVTIPRYALGLGLKKIYPPGLWSGISCTYADEFVVPELPNENWSLVKTRLGGICGSDLSAIYLSVSPYFQPFNSFPFTIGHENIGLIELAGEGVNGFTKGDRVIVEPTLWCAPRGFSDWCKFCRRGEINSCLRKTEGDLAPGLSIGFCRDTGGSWGPYFLAHQSQLYKVPDAMSDENGLMVEPFATGLHAVLLDPPEDHETVLVIGAGTIGLVTLASLRALDCSAKVIVLARYSFQADAAVRLGADEVILDRDQNAVEEIGRRVDGKILTPMIGKKVLVGGVDRTYDCVGSSSSLDDALRLTVEGGRVILVGVPGIPRGVDWTAPFLKELSIKGSHIYHHAELWRGERRKTFDIAIELLQSGKVDLSWLVTHRLSPEDYDLALRLQSKRGSEQVIKTVFEFKD